MAAILHAILMGNLKHVSKTEKPLTLTNWSLGQGLLAPKNVCMGRYSITRVSDQISIAYACEMADFDVGKQN